MKLQRLKIAVIQDHNSSYHLSRSGSGCQSPNCPATKNPDGPLNLFLKSGSLFISCTYLEFLALLWQYR